MSVRERMLDLLELKVAKGDPRPRQAALQSAGKHIEVLQKKLSGHRSGRLGPMTATDKKHIDDLKYQIRLRQARGQGEKPVYKKGKA